MARRSTRKKIRYFKKEWEAVERRARCVGEKPYTYVRRASLGTVGGGSAALRTEIRLIRKGLERLQRRQRESGDVQGSEISARLIDRTEVALSHAGGIGKRAEAGRLRAGDEGTTETSTPVR